MQESLVSVSKGDLRAVPATTSQPAGEDQKGKTKSYGFVLPLDVTLPAVTFPPPMQPRCMFSMFRVK
jgi:hypothetical protein